MLELTVNSRNHKTYLSIINEKFEYVINNPVLLLGIISFIAILIRIYFFPVGIPIVLDGWGYFWYANDMSILGEFPTTDKGPNNGWPAFLSIFFSLYHSQNFLDYMALQRIVSAILSVLTIVPVYLLCRRFFDKHLSMIGAALFVLDPRIIMNSLLGITEPLFILLGTSSLVLFFSKDVKKVYFSFVLAALFALIRYEGLLLVIPLSIMFIVRFRKEKIFKIVLRYISVLTIFVLVLLPMAYIRIQTTGNDGLISHVSAGPAYVSTISQKEDEGARNLVDFFVTGIINLVKYLGWVTIPIFIFFLPFGVFKFFKKLDYKNTTILLVSIFFLLPAFYAYGREIQETRYLYVIFPVFSMLSLYTVDILRKRTGKHSLIFILLIVGIISASIVWVDYKWIDLEHEKEAFTLATNVVKLTSGINEYYPESTYIGISSIVGKDFPILSKDVPLSNRMQPLSDVPKFVSAKGTNSIEEYIKFGKEKGLSHLVVDGLGESHLYRSKIFDEVFYNEEKFPYLIKEYDSAEHGFNYHLKIFRVDYEKFEE